MQRSTKGREQQDGVRKWIHTNPNASQPKRSRRLGACQECQKQKVKCNIEAEDSSCTRCKKHSIRCIVNKSLQTLLEDDYEWKRAVEQNTTQLQTAVSSILQHLEMLTDSPKPGVRGVKTRSPQGPSASLDDTTGTRYLHSELSIFEANTPESMFSSESECSTPSTPMASLFEVTKLRNLRVLATIDPETDSHMVSDFISSGRISLQIGEEMFERFLTLLYRYPWCQAALIHENLMSVRKSSSLLLAVVITVAALHAPGMEELYEVAYSEFTALLCDSMFSERHSLDDIRAFCIGALWLPDISWKLSDHAIRIATQLGIHKSVAKAIRGQSGHIERARLWYLLYVCDHQLSIAYGRPTLMPEDVPTSDHMTFLQLPGISQFDWHLHSHVAICYILGRLYRRFGKDTDKGLSEDDLSALQAFNAEIDNWRVGWESRLVPVHDAADIIPYQGITMHWNCAKLQVNALALRSLSSQKAHFISNQRRHFANLAVAHALNTFQLSLNGSSNRNFISSVELYQHTMITYAAVFLLKVHKRWAPARLNVDIRHTIDVVERSAQLLSQEKTEERHLAWHVANGLLDMLARFKELERAELESNIGVADMICQSSWEACQQGPVFGSGLDGRVENPDFYPVDQSYLPSVYV